MSLSRQLTLWRKARGRTQERLAADSGLTRAYISRLESGNADPSLSSVSQIAAALELSVGQLLESRPPRDALDRQSMDGLARAALWPGTKAARHYPATRVLSQLIRERRKTVGLLVERPTKRPSADRPAPGHHAARWLRVALGETQWAALMNRIDKLISLHAAQQGTVKAP